MRLRSLLSLGAFALAAPLLPTSPASASASPLDPAWGSGGVASHELYFRHVGAVAAQRDGKVVVAGHGQPEVTLGQYLVRLDANGAVDPHFGVDGRVMTASIDGLNSMYATDVAVQPDGRIVAVGAVREEPTGDPYTHFGVVRYLPDGSLDPSFDGNGGLWTTFDQGKTMPAAVAVQPDGKIVVAGIVSVPGATRPLVVARYLPNGALDASFDGDGRFVASLADTAFVTDVAADAAGRVVLFASNGATNRLVRLLDDGQLDPGFGDDGVAAANFGPELNRGGALALTPDGSILASGVTTVWPDWFAAVARFRSDGSPDPAFGDGGRVVVDEFAAGLMRPGLAVLPDEGIVLTVGGATSDVVGTVEGSRLSVAVLSSGGELDAGFDGDGIFELPLDDADGYQGGTFAAVLTDGRVVVASPHGLDTSTVRTVTTARVATRPAALGVVLGATPNPATAGPVTFVATVRNDGPADAGGVGLDFELSSGTITGVRGGGGACRVVKPSSRAVCAWPTLAAGGEMNVAFTTTVTGSEEGLFGTATVTTSSYDPDASDDAATAEVIISRDPTS